MSDDIRFQISDFRFFPLCEGTNKSRMKKNKKNERNQRHRHLLDGSRRLCAARDSRLKISANHKRNCSLRKGPACQLNKKQHAHKATTTFLVVEEEQKKRQTLLREQEKSITYHIQHHHHHLLSFIFYIKSALSLSQRLHPSYYHLE